MDELRIDRARELALSPARQATEGGQPGIDRARRISTAFAEAMMEAAQNLAPDSRIEDARLAIENLARQTAAMNVLASRTSPMFNAAMIGYAAQLANQVNLEANIPPHYPLRSHFGDRFSERDRSDGHVRVPPVNETRGGPSVL